MTGQYFQVPNIIFQFELRPISFLVYCYLKRCCNQALGCFPSKTTIAKACGIAGSSVDNALKELKQKELITVEYRYADARQISNRYEFNDLNDVWHGQHSGMTLGEAQQAAEAEALPL